MFISHKVLQKLLAKCRLPIINIYHAVIALLLERAWNSFRNLFKIQHFLLNFIIKQHHISKGDTYVEVQSMSLSWALIKNRNWHFIREHRSLALTLKSMPSPQFVTTHSKPSALARSLVVSVFPVPAGPAGAPPKNIDRAFDDKPNSKAKPGLDLC